MKILAVETSTDACSAALWLDGAIQEEFRCVELSVPKVSLVQIMKFTKGELYEEVADCTACRFCINNRNIRSSSRC